MDGVFVEIVFIDDVGEYGIVVCGSVFGVGGLGDCVCDVMCCCFCIESLFLDCVECDY